MKPTDSTPHPKPSRPSAVLDPAWEDVLRAGQEQDGAAGSVDGELAMIHLLRHARGPEPLPEGAIEGVWRELDGAITPVPWWRRGWVLWGTPVVAAAAVLFVFLRGPGDMQETGGADSSAVAELSGDSAASLSATLEQQFSRLEPGARRALDSRVDDGRGALRGQLLAMAMDKPTGGDR